MSQSALSISLRSSKPCARKDNFWNRLCLWQAESPTSEPRVRTCFSMIWRAKERDCKLCVMWTTTRVFKASLKSTPNSEEVTSSVWLVNRAEPTEENFQLLQEKSFCYRHACICCLKPMSVSRINKPDTERDIWTWSWTRKLEIRSLSDQRLFHSSEGTWLTWNSSKSKPPWWTWFQVEPQPDPSSPITTT